MIEMRSKDIVMVPVENITPRPDNRNKHSDEQIQRLSEIIQYQGFRDPLIISNQTQLLVSGHGRVMAAKKLGLKELPVIYQDFDTPEQEYAAMVSENSIASWAELDFSGINNDLGDLGPDFNIDMLGIENFEIDVADKDGLTDPDEVPEPPKEPKTKRGDIYKLGNHRLMCGDSTMIDDVSALLADEKPNLMITDPPYGVNYEAGWRADAKGSKKTEREETSSLQNDDRADWYDAWVLFPGELAYVWHASSFTDVVMDSLRRSGFEIKQQIIWNKNIHALSRSSYHWKHEPCWYAVKKGAQQRWLAGRDQMTVWDVKTVQSEKDKTSHPTQKPIEIYIRPLENHTKPGECVYEPFGGSGSSIIACERTGRNSITMELDPRFCDVIVSRWENFTGQKAELINAGNNQ